MSLTPLPTAPSRDRPSTFSTDADALLGALAAFVEELNLVAIGESASALALNLGSSDPTKGPAILPFDPTLNYTLGTIGYAQADDPINPRTAPWNAKGDGTTDDTAALNICAAWCATNKKLFRPAPTSAGYNITSTVTFTGLQMDMRGAFFTYSGTHDRPALVIGTSGSGLSYGQYSGLDVRSASGDWTAAAYIGIRTYNLNRCYVDVRKAEGFFAGFDAFCDSNNGWAYNRVDVGTLLDNCRSMRLTSTGTSCFVNENTFIGGRYGNSSASSARGTGYGIEVTSTDGLYVSHNNNRWISPCFELNPTNAAITRIPVYLNGAGSSSKIIAARAESNGGVFALCDGLNRAGAAVHCDFDVTYFGGSQSINSITQQNGACGNTYRSFSPGSKVPGSYVTPDLAACIKPFGTNVMSLLGPWTYYTNGGTVLRKVTDSTVEATRNGVRINTSASVIGVEVDTSRNKQWLIRIKSNLNTRNGRAVIRLWDSTDTQVTASTMLASVVCESTASAVATTANFGGAWQSASDGSGTDRAFVVLVDATVTRMHVGFAGGSNVGLGSGIELEPLPFDGGAQMAIRVFSSIGQEMAGTSTAKPDTYVSHGWVRKGEIITNASAAVGAAAGWMVTTATAWAISTAYTVGQIRSNAGNLYEVTVAGTSAGSGAGPTSLGAAITDGTVTWKYVAYPCGNAPAWVTATAYTQYQIRSNAGGLYEAQADGTSGATAPTGTGSVSDGTVTWKFVGLVATYGTLPNLT